MKHLKNFKLFEIKLQDMPFTKIERRINLKEYKYKEEDIVYHIELEKAFIVKSINRLSDLQDYYIINPLDTTERAFVIEEELRDPKPSEKEEIETILTTNKYNL